MIHVVEHDPAWVDAFDAEAARIRCALGPIAVRIQHIGSTAIAGIKAKPIIDLLLEVGSLAALDAHAPSLEALGYTPLGEFGIGGRRYFNLNDASGVRTHQMHAFEAGTPGAVRHVVFRDYMRAHPSIAEAYGALKAHLASAHAHDPTAYKDGKAAFVDEHERRALAGSSAARRGAASPGPCGNRAAG